MYVPSSELGLSQPFSRKRVCLSPKNRGGGAYSPAGEGLGESQFQRLKKSLALCLLCALWSLVTRIRASGRDVLSTKDFTLRSEIIKSVWTHSIESLQLHKFEIFDLVFFTYINKTCLGWRLREKFKHKIICTRLIFIFTYFKPMLSEGLKMFNACY